MKRNMIFLFLFLILNLNSEIKNLIENGGFEKYKEGEKMPDGWVINTGYPCKVTIMEDSEIAYEGKVFLRIDEDKEKTKGNSGAIYYEKGLKIKKDTEYKFSVYAKGKGKISLFIYEYNDGGFLGSVSSGDIELTGEWKEYILNYIPGVVKYSNPNVIRICPAIHIKDSAYIDNAVFIEVERKN
jgi:hypothetical protein